MPRFPTPLTTVQGQKFQHCIAPPGVTQRTQNVGQVLSRSKPAWDCTVLRLPSPQFCVYSLPVHRGMQPEAENPGHCSQAAVMHRRCELRSLRFPSCDVAHLGFKTLVGRASSAYRGARLSGQVLRCGT
jgi:hypothetical protein